MRKFAKLRGMETRKHYSVAEQEMVIGLYEESGRTQRSFVRARGWSRETAEAGAVKFVEVEHRLVAMASWRQTSSRMCI